MPSSASSAADPAHNGTNSHTLARTLFSPDPRPFTTHTTTLCFTGKPNAAAKQGDDGEESLVAPKSKASLVVAYILWLTTGWMGGHLFYLGRYYQGTVWLQTCGAGILGWLRDAFVLPRYVAEANQEPGKRDTNDRSVLQLTQQTPSQPTSPCTKPSAATSNVFLLLTFGASRWRHPWQAFTMSWSPLWRRACRQRCRQ